MQHTMIRDDLKMGQKYYTVPRAQERESERTITGVERTSEASNAEQVNEYAVRANERVNGEHVSEQPSTYLSISRGSV